MEIWKQQDLSCQQCTYNNVDGDFIEFEHLSGNPQNFKCKFFYQGNLDSDQQQQQQQQQQFQNLVLISELYSPPEHATKQW